jgi:hypothetical protein
MVETGEYGTYIYLTHYAPFLLQGTSGHHVRTLQTWGGETMKVNVPLQAYIQKRHAQVTIPTARNTKNKKLHLHKFIKVDRTST